MKFFYFKSVTFISLFFLFCSCQKNEALSEGQSAVEQEISVKNGMLVFKNSDVLKRTIQKVSSLSSDEYAQWVKNYPGFESYKSTFYQARDEFEALATLEELSEFKGKYANIVNITKDTSLAEKFASPVISSFVNKEGQFRVGDSINVLTEDRWILIANTSRTNIQDAKLYTKTDSLKGVFITSYANSGDRIESSDVKSVAAGGGLQAMSDPNPPYFPGAYAFKYSSAYMESSGVFFDQTYYNNDRDRRLFVKLIHDVYPVQTGNSEPESTSIFSLYVNQESKKLFGWGTNKTGFDVKIDYIIVGRQNRPPLAFPVYDNYGSSAINWQKYDTKGPYTFTLFNGYGFTKAINGSMRIWSQGVPNNPTNI